MRNLILNIIYIKVMGMASKKMAGRADGRAISTIVKKLLA